MPTPLPLEELLRGWTAPPLRPAWIEIVRRALEALRPPGGRASAKSPRPHAAVEAWAELGTLFGDSGAPELCAVVLRHGLSQLSEPDGTDAAARLSERLRAGLHLALADLGLAAAKEAGPLLVANLGSSLVPDPTRVERWLAEFLAPVGGELRRGAELALLLAAIRAGLLPRPRPLTVAAVEALGASS